MASKEIKRDPLKWKDSKTDKGRSLILHNDDVHSFDYVIEALIEVCGHDYIQASQCAMITHYKGKCDIRRGNLKSLGPLKDALINRELKATID